jgi:hypothetical protein
LPPPFLQRLTPRKLLRILLLKLLRRPKAIVDVSEDTTSGVLREGCPLLILLHGDVGVGHGCRGYEDECPGRELDDEFEIPED